MAKVPRCPEVLYGIPSKEIARICQVDLRTARRWKRGDASPPLSALMMLSRNLGHLDPKWEGWTIRGGEIISPDGRRISRDDALIVQLMHGQIAALRYDLAKARAELDTLKASQTDDQPLPSQWTGAVKSA